MARALFRVTTITLRSLAKRVYQFLLDYYLKVYPSDIEPPYPYVQWCERSPSLLYNLRPCTRLPAFLCSTIVLNVKFILGVVMSLVVGSRCTQNVCVVPFITNKLPCSKIISTFLLVVLCFRANFRSAPKLNEPIVPSFFRSVSPSLCHAIPSAPL